MEFHLKSRLPSERRWRLARINFQSEFRPEKHLWLAFPAVI
jgi:hypothetical protein